MEPREDGTLQRGQLMELERGDGTTRRGNNAKRTVDGTGEGSWNHARMEHCKEDS